VQRTWRTRCVLGIAFATMAATGVAFAQQQMPQQPGQQQPPSGQQPSEQAPQGQQLMAERMSATATVVKVDTKERRLTLKDERGTEFRVHVPEQVSRFEAIKKGDKIRVDYYEALALAIKKPEEGKAPSAGEVQMAERTPGPLPGGMVARKLTGTAEVVKVDAENNRITLKGPKGEADTIDVTDPAMQQQLSRLKKGDRIQVSYTEAVAIDVMPQQKQEKPEKQR